MKTNAIRSVILIWNGGSNSGRRDITDVLSCFLSRGVGSLKRYARDGIQMACRV